VSAAFGAYFVRRGLVFPTILAASAWTDEFAMPVLEALPSPSIRIPLVILFGALV
jgi:hypothetical protein